MRASAALALASAAALWGSSSGLNNIPTTDTAGNHVIVLQDYVTAGPRAAITNFVAFKMGYDFLADTPSPLRLEWGMDGRTNPLEGSAALLQVKLSYQPAAQGPAFAWVRPTSRPRPPVGRATVTLIRTRFFLRTSALRGCTAAMRCRRTATTLRSWVSIAA